MSIAAIAGVADVVSLVVGLAPQLIDDTMSLSTLFSDASNAVQNAAPDGSVAPADWAALKQQESDLQTLLAEEAQAAQVAVDAASSIPGAAQS